MQLMGDLSYTFGTPRWFGFPQTRLGMRGTYRSLDVYSNRYCPVQEPDATGEPVCVPMLRAQIPAARWEFRTLPAPSRCKTLLREVTGRRVAVADLQQLGLQPLLHASTACVQRGWKRQPAGGLIRLGG